MWCDPQFQSFNEKIELDASRWGRIESALGAFETFCQNDKELSAAADGKPFLQGSIATRTAVRPLLSDEFDVDVIYPFRLSAFSPQPTPQQVINWFLKRLKESAFYRSNLIAKNRCARIDYAGDFHVDFIPSTQELNSHQPCAVPARDLGSWITNNPIGFANWVQLREDRGGGTDQYGDGFFVRSIRIMKRWRDQFFSQENAPSSMLLVTFLGNHDPTVKNYFPPLDNPLFPEHQHDAAFLYDMLRLTHSCLQNPGLNAFENPSVPGEDLGCGWQHQHLQGFLTRLGNCIEHLRLGLWADSDADSIAHYRNAFGDTFPAQ